MPRRQAVAMADLGMSPFPRIVSGSASRKISLKISHPIQRPPFARPPSLALLGFFAVLPVESTSNQDPKQGKPDRDRGEGVKGGVQSGSQENDAGLRHIPQPDAKGLNRRLGFVFRFPRGGQ